MLTRRQFLCSVASLLGVLAFAAPAGTMLWWSWSAAEKEAQAELLDIAKATVRKANSLIMITEATLRSREELAGEHCSPVHLSRLRSATIRNPFIDEIGIYRDNTILCNTWGASRSRMHQSAWLPVTGSGMRMHTNCHSEWHPWLRMVCVLADGPPYGTYALIQPVRFIDLPRPAGVSVTLSLRDGDEVVASVFADKTAHDAVAPARPHLVARWEDGGFRAVVASPVPLGMVQAHKRMLWPSWLLPSLAITAVLLGVIYCWLRRSLSLHGELEAALARRDLRVHYQPIIELATNRCIGAEALVRWHHKERGWIPANIIVALAEAHGMSSDITRTVIEAVSTELGPALRADRGLHVSVNLSAQDMRGDQAFSFLDAHLHDNDIAQSQLWLEATERGFINVAEVHAGFDRARARGHLIAIDDFGTGYSSLSYLQTLPLDLLKIDKSFVDPIVSDGVAVTMVDYVIHLAKSLQLIIVAEGIETAAQRDYLRARGVTYGQGWYFGKAMPVADFLAFREACNQPGTSRRDGDSCGGSMMVADPREDHGDGRQ